MNPTRKRIIALAVVIAIAMFFFPPFQVGTAFSLDTHHLGYAFITDAPFLGKINYALLLAQWVALAAVTAVLVWLTSRK